MPYLNYPRHCARTVVYIDGVLLMWQGGAQRGEGVRVQAVWQDVQALLHSLHAPADPLGHAALPVSVLRQTLPSEVRHEETYIHPHRYVLTRSNVQKLTKKQLLHAKLRYFHKSWHELIF